MRQYFNNYNKKCCIECLLDKGGSRLGNFKPLFQNQNVIYLKSEGIRAKYILYIYA